jgi:hypothetical protein
MVDPNAAFKRKKQPELTVVVDNGETYYKIKCLLCDYDRYILLSLWGKDKPIHCPNCNPDHSWVRI